MSGTAHYVREYNLRCSVAQDSVHSRVCFHLAQIFHSGIEINEITRLYRLLTVIRWTELLNCSTAQLLN